MPIEPEPISGYTTTTGEFTEPSVIHKWAEASGVVATTTATIITIASGTTKVRGFAGSGNGDGYFFIEVDGVKKYAFTTSVIAPNVAYIFPQPENLVGEIKLKVTNISTGTSAYSGAVFLGG